MLSKERILDMAAEIIEVVSAAGCPVTLSHIEREVDGFAGVDPTGTSWAYKPSTDGPFIWSGMTAEGLEALILAWRSGLVAICPVGREAYLRDGRYPTEPDWLPVMLAPADLANIDGHGRLFYFPSGFINELIEMMGYPGDRANWREILRH